MYTKVFGLELKLTDVRTMMTAIKIIESLGSFAAFHLCSVYENTFKTAAQYVLGKDKNYYVSEGNYFN
jgi:hypothetical protein